MKVLSISIELPILRYTLIFYNSATYSQGKFKPGVTVASAAHETDLSAASGIFCILYVAFELLRTAIVSGSGTHGGLRYHHAHDLLMSS